MDGDNVAESTQIPLPDRNDSNPTPDSVTVPESLLLRVDTDRPPIWLGESDGEPGSRRTTNEPDNIREFIIVDNSARATRINVSERVDGGRVESFLSATDFGAETVYIDTVTVEECMRLKLCLVGWTATSISTDYSRRSRPYTARCGVDERVIEARLIRIPDAIEADDVHKHSRSIGSGVCDHHRGRPDGETPAHTTDVNEQKNRTATTPTGSGDGQ